MRIFFGNKPQPFHMSATRRYYPEELQHRADILIKNDQQLYLQVENEMHRLSAADVPLAVTIVASYHNQICYNIPPEDGWNEETCMMEARARARMTEVGATDESDFESG
jgi:hypothetical protein